ncbi:MAG TPA: phospholipase D-like domain-containing protein [Methanothrix sp.]|jgi:phosphatidylserine/phosphatidylglycerophosphate/cardiolipin synthase-like enzyme|nr:hypothetical protein [Methanothrix sp.]HPC89766.1 phospholipase D-like domain-containing protein [Methanothrix sp.]HQE87735.1 phospholipase D-like domain-containing protein [Methanothrix sp.]HQI68042.1 phospholipase D-like domain-containing protein [Methanothrix sp.]HRS85217.1 phospholipase D-like domain-containing protein [Methanothrix sp.]
MEGYSFWLVLLAAAILSASIMQMQARAGHRLALDCRRLKSEIDLLQGRLREKEARIDRLQRNLAELLKWRSRAAELEAELKAAKQSQEYLSAARLHFLEDSLALHEKETSSKFLATIPSSGASTAGAHTGGRGFEERLQRMLEEADFEVVIVSPWIKRQTWNRISGELKRFTRKGGRLRVFTRGSSSDYALGLADDICGEISAVGGDIVLVPRLHAKIYMADRRQAIITSANLTKGGTEGNYESGLLVSDPAIIKDICDFLEEMAAFAS